LFVTFSNSALRDPALARCVDTPHQITGTQFKCYPTYDLAIVICDDLEGVTHAMRDSQYQERIPLYQVLFFLFV
jgi:glutamyl-tRNA synthetase